jgi:hypothetical protein
LVGPANFFGNIDAIGAIPVETIHASAPIVAEHLIRAAHFTAHAILEHDPSRAENAG